MILPPADTGRRRDRLTLPKRLFKVLAEHMRAGACGDRRRPALALLGKPGWGKTTCTIAALEKTGAVVRVAHPDLFGSPLESGSCKALRECFLDAARLRDGGTGGPVPVAVLFDDLHLGLGRDERMTATTNYGFVVGLLQGLIDDPTRVFGKPTPYLPIFFTMNTLAGLPASLRRPGRMRVLQWSFTPAELAATVCGMFPRVSREQAATLVALHPGEPVSFYADLRSLWQDRQTSFDPDAAAADVRLALQGEWRAAAVREPSGKELIDFASAVTHDRDPGKEASP